VNRLEKWFLVLTCIGAFATALTGLLEKWKTIPTRIETRTETRTVRVEVTPKERMYCESRFCVYATPDGLRIENYTDKALFCKTMPALKEKAGAAANNGWWAIGRPGPFLTCASD
jgi:hypothetical protein